MSVSSPSPRQEPAADSGSDPQGSGGTPEAAEAPSGGIERRRHPRIRVEEVGAEALAVGFREAERRQSERRQGERRGSGGLRDNVGWTVAADRGSRVSGRRNFRIKKSRLFVLGFAVIAGGIAAYMASQIGRPQVPVAPAAASTATTRILVASQEIAVGQRLSPGSLTWAAWPAKALQSDYVTATATPDAMADMSGLVARIGFLPGDPIRKAKLAKGSGGFLSNTLDSGMRGVSVAVSAESASGGFVSPNDRVDVVLTRTTAASGVGTTVPRSETVLRNVLVLAINSEAAKPGAAGDPRDAPFAGHAIATLALDPADADLVVSAASIGKLSLLLRSGIDASHPDTTAKARDSADQAIRLSSPFWLR